MYAAEQPWRLLDTSFTKAPRRLIYGYHYDLNHIVYLCALVVDYKSLDFSNVMENGPSTLEVF